MSPIRPSAPQDLTFQSISANGAASGIVLNTTGSLGGLTVTGTDGADAGAEPDAGTGGTITNTTSHGVSLTNANNVSLGGLIVSNTGHHGINVSGGSIPDARLARRSSTLAMPTRSTALTS